MKNAAPGVAGAAWFRRDSPMFGSQRPAGGTRAAKTVRRLSLVR